MIPYNPSSFNSNKTILEQILELKKWLKEHPSYAVYTTYIHYKPAENVDYFFTEINGDPDFVDNIAVGDLLWFGDGYISPIASITIDPNDRENSYVTISQPVTSLIGPTGPQGPRGYDGVSVTNASVNASGYLIITLSNGLTVNTGYVVGPQGPQGPTGATGPQGPTGPTGADGNDGVSITNVAIDGNSHLIVTLSDGSSIDAGSVSSGISSVSLNNIYSGTLNDADYNILANNENAYIIFTDSNSKKIIARRFYETSNGLYYTNMSINTSSTTGIGYIFISITKNTKAFTAERIINNKYIRSWTIDSETATNGQVLQADGNGGASWQTPSGSGVNVVTLNALSGTLTNEEYNTLLNENSIIDYYVTNHKLYVKKQETSTEMRFDYLDQYDYISRYTINKSTKAYSHSYVKLTYSGIDSGTATNGQVLTANGNGGASWQNAGGGGKYMHYVRLNNGNYSVYFSYIDSNSSQAVNISTLATRISQVTTNRIQASGFLEDGSNVVHPVIAIQSYDASTFNVIYADYTAKTQGANSLASWTIGTEVIIPL